MKTNKKFVSFIGISLFALCILTSCGGNEDEDPQPQKTDLEKVKEGIIGFWDLKSIAVTKDGVTETFNGGCDESGLSSSTQANVGDIDYEFTSATSLKKYINCPSTNSDTFTYTITEVSGVFTVTISDGRSFKILTTPNDISGSEVRVESLNNIQGVSKSVWIFTK